MLGTWFGSGWSPFAPGTAGTAASLPLVWALAHLPGLSTRWMAWNPWCLAASLLLFFPAVAAATHVERALGKHDPGPVVVDETLGTLLTVAFVPAAALSHWQVYAIAFFLFRLLDVWKPGVIGHSQALPRGWGIVVDDVLAGLLGGVLLALLAQVASVRDAVPRDPRFSVEDLGNRHPAWAEQVLIPRLARAWGADVLHYPDNSGALSSRVPTVLTLHDTLWLRPLRQAIAHPTPRQRLQDAYRKFVCPRAARAAAAVLTVSAESAACLRRELGLDAAKIFQSVEGVDAIFTRSLPAGEAARRRAALGLKGPYVLCSGASDRRKNIDRLIRAFAAARRLRGPLKGAALVVTSLRPGEAATTTYAATAREAGVEAAVRFLPYVSDADLKALYQGAVVFAFPSLGEGFGLPVLEAYAMGCPVLTSDVSALPEVAGAGAVYADPLSVDGIAAGLALAASGLGGAARKRAAAAQLKRYTWDRAAAQHWRAYQAASRD